MKDKVILVTGANRGIGLNIIQRLNNDGYTVIGTSRTSDCLLYTSDAADE